MASLAVGARTSSVGRRIAIAAAAIGVIYGYDIGNISGALLLIDQQMDLTEATKSSITTVLVAGNILGALVAGKLATSLGRKRTMVLVAAGYTVFAAACGLATGVVTLDIARFLLGITIGISIVVAPVFVAESSPAAIRGTLVVGYQVATVTGIMLGYLVDWALVGFGSWRLMLAISALPSILVLLVLLRLPDTPRWYVMRGRRQEARDTLALIDPDVDPEHELSAMDADLAAERGGSIKETLRKPFTTATMFVLVLGFLVQITGINAITYYSPLIFKQMDFSGMTALLGLPSLVQACALIATIGSLFAVDRLGRRPVLLGGIIGMVAASALMILVFGTGISSVWGFVGILVFTAAYNCGLGSLVWVYASESFPARLRAQGASFMLTANLVANLIIAQFFLPMMDGLGGVATFGFFLVLAVLALLFVFRFAPETKGRQLESIRHYWENGARWPDA